MGCPMRDPDPLIRVRGYGCLMLTDSTRARKAQEKARERERRYYQQRIKDMEEDQ